VLHLCWRHGVFCFFCVFFAGAGEGLKRDRGCLCLFAISWSAFQCKRRDNARSAVRFSESTLVTTSCLETCVLCPRLAEMCAKPEVNDATNCQTDRRFKMFAFVHLVGDSWWELGRLQSLQMGKIWRKVCQLPSCNFETQCVSNT
jgi:hypothetical protein